MIGLIQEHGPCRITNDSSTVKLNPYSWNNNANVLYIDQPVGVGFSHGDLKVGTSQQAAADVWTFLQIFLSDARFSKYATNKLAIWTESYVFTILRIIDAQFSSIGMADITDLLSLPTSSNKMLPLLLVPFLGKASTYRCWESETALQCVISILIYLPFYDEYVTGSIVTIPRIHQLCWKQPIPYFGASIDDQECKYIMDFVRRLQSPDYILLQRRVQFCLFQGAELLQ